jgi:hypothetical protein
MINNNKLIKPAADLPATYTMRRAILSSDGGVGGSRPTAARRTVPRIFPRKATALLAVVFLTACNARLPLSLSRTENPDYSVELLFTHDGCSVFRFSDGGYDRYFTNCHGSTSWAETCGKSCHREIAVAEGGR